MEALEQRVEWMEHNGKKILKADYSHLKGEDLMIVFRKSKSTQEKAGSDVLLMVDFTGAKANNEIVSALKEAGKELDKDMKKTAVIGLAPLQRIFYNGYIQVTGQGFKTKVFLKQQDSLEWLRAD